MLEKGAEVLVERNKRLVVGIPRHRVAIMRVPDESDIFSDIGCNFTHCGDLVCQCKVEHDAESA